MINGSLDIKQLRVFMAVASDLHFARAGERLGVTQSSISQQIKLLEERVGVKLLHRTTRNVKLTPAGEAFLAQVQDGLATLDAAPRIAALTARGAAGELRIGFITSAMVSTLPDAIHRFREKFPAVTLQLRHLNSKTQMDELMSQKLDLGFIRTPIRESSLYTQVVVREGFVAVIHTKHELARKKDFRLADLAGQPLVQHNHHPEIPFQSRLLALCQQAGFRPNIAQETADTTGIVGLVASGVGIAILPVSVANFARHPNVVFRPLKDLPRMAEIAAVCRQEETSARVKNFLRLLAETPPDPAE
jgi:DNA-binding transcriptional LysR family regulator